MNAFNYLLIAFNVFGYLVTFWVMYITIPLLVYRHKQSKIPKSIVFYIFVLCIGASTMMTGMIFLNIFFIQKTFLFPKVVCQAFIMNEKITTFLAPIIVLLISHTCHSMVCGDMDAQKKAALVKNAAYKVLIVFLVITVILIPIPLYTEVVHVVPRDFYVCTFNPPELIQSLFLYLACSVSFASPLLGILYWYISVPIFLKKRATTNTTIGHSSNAAIKKVIKTVVVLTLIYLVFWLPYWINLFRGSDIQQLMGWLGLDPSTMKYIILAINIFPYISSISYPVIFTVMNRSLRKEHEDVINIQKRRWQRIPSDVINTFHSTFNVNKNRRKQSKFAVISAKGHRMSGNTSVVEDFESKFSPCSENTAFITKEEKSTLTTTSSQSEMDVISPPNTTIIDATTPPNQQIIQIDPYIYSEEDETTKRVITPDSITTPHQDDCIL